MNRHFASYAESPEAEVIGQMQNTQFIENLGQFGNTEVAFYGHLGSSGIGFCTDSVRFWTGSLGESIILSFEGAKRTEPRGATPQSSSNNYFLGERGTYANAKGFKSIVYEGLWPGIDLIFTATKGGIKYEFHLSAHADPNEIKMRYEGHQTLNVKSTSLAALNGEWIVNDEGLMAIQSGKKIEAAFVSCSEDTVGIKVDAYDRSRALTIDPLIYCTYLGGSGPERANDVFVDDSGQTYITGRTRSTDFPAVSAFDETYSSGEDCYVLKLGSDGQSIIYSTYIGGTGDDVGYSITCDDSGNAYVTGYTRSADFPTVNAYDDTFGGDRDCFVFRLNSTGTGLDFSTYLGDVNREIGWCIDLDNSGNVYVSGDTASINFPTVNAYDDSYNFGGDCFVTKFDSTGSSIIFSTFIGGSVLDYGYSMVVNGSGHVYLSGSTNSANFPMVNAYDSTHNGADDCFVLLLNASGDALIFSTYIGGHTFDYAYDLAVDALGYSYIAGASLSDDYPVVNAYESQFGGDTDCIVSKLSRDGSSLVFSTYLGGTNRDEAQDIAVDSFGCVYITGFTGSSDFPIEAAFDSTYNGNDECFVAKFNNTGDTLLYSTFVGGTSNDYGWGIAVDSWGNATIAGYTGSTDFPTTSGAVNETLNGNIDCFVFRLPDYGDNDADNLTNYDEYVQGTGLWNPDSDNDTMIDGWEVANLLNPLVNDTLGDPDLDLLINLLEYQYSTDPQDSDSDDDALDDYTEIFVEGTDPNDSDSDNDLLDDGSEVNTHGTDPLDPDSEDDGMPDGWEVLYSLLPLTNDSLGDPDLDDLVNLDEYFHGTNPQDWDSDDDDMPDGWEVANGLNPTVKDKSGDPDGDSLSNYGEYLSNTDPQDPDSDDDNMWDGWEVVNGLDPLTDDSGEDPDEDTLNNLAEFLLSTNPHSNDTDADTMVDGWEVSNSLDPLVDDTGGDPDGDLYTNIEEYIMGTDPQNPAPAWTEEPTDQSLEYGTAFMYDLNATDADGIHMWWINSTAYFVIDGSGLITNITPLAVAAYGLEVHVNDTEGNYRWVIFRVTVADTLAPEWVEIPDDQHTAQRVAFRYDLNATDLSGLSQWWVNDSLNFLVDSNGIITNATRLPLGKLNLTIFVNDTYGNTRSAIITITVHSGEAPIWEEPLEHQQSEFGQVFLYDVNASGPYIIDYYWVNDTVRFSIDSNGIITNNTFLAVGGYRLEIRAYNIFGYYCNATINVSIIDTTNPTWDWLPIDQIVEFGQVFRYDVNASDLSTIDHWTISDVTNFGIDSNGEITNATFLTIGEYYVEIRAYDPYNNYCNVTFKITVSDTTSPTWDQTPLNQVVEYGENLNYNLNASDLSSIDHWIVNDTVSFSISSEGLLENIALLSVGEYHIEVRAYDPFSNYVSANITVIIQDTTDPTWDWTPADQIVEFGDDFTYDVNASDLSGITSWWTNDTSSFAIDSDGLLTNSTPLSVGDHWIEIRAYDPYGNFGSATIKVTVQDTTSPKWIEIPVTRIVELGLSFSYDLNASDPSGIGQWTVDDTTNFDIDPNGFLTNASTLSVGSYWIEIRAYDIYGNYLSASISINVTDTTAPNWDVPPIDQVLELGHDMSYDLNASDLSGIDHWTINNTVDFSISSAGIVTNIVRLAVGTYWVEVSAYDPYGNILAFAFMVTVQDTTAPTWDPVPENQVLELGTGFLYNLDAVDLSTIDHWTINNTLDFSIDSSGTVANNTALTAGMYYLEVRAYDPFNNYCFAIFSVTVEDTTDPIWLQVPTDQIVEMGEVFRYDVNATDLGGLSLWWINDTINFEIDANGVITNRTALSVRSYAVRVLAFDPSSNFVAATFTITVEDTSPPIWILDPTDRIVEVGAPISITLEAFDFSEMASWAVNDTTHFSIDASGTITNATELTLGTYGLQVTVEDVYGNSLSANFSITVVDNSAPTWDELPTNQILEFGDAFCYNLNASDLSGIEFYWTNDSDFIIDINGVISSIMTIPVGEVVLEVRAYDPIGLYCTATFAITVVDTRGPSWVIAPSNQVIEYGTSFTYSLAAIDLSGIDRYEMNNSLFSIDGFGVLRNATILNVGIYWLEVNAFDIYDNNCTAILSVTVEDTVAPSWTTVPANMNIEYGTHVLIISNAVDLSGIDRYWINDTRYFVILLNGRIANTTTVPVGIHALKIRAYDVHDNYCEHEFRIRIMDTIAPTLILTPDDVEIEVGSIGYVLAWSAYDLRPDSYEILDNEVSIRTGLWNASLEVITLSLDGLAIGTHEFTIIFMDESGNTGSDTVVVLVEEITTTTSTTTATTTTTSIADGFLLAAIVLSVGGGTAVVLVIILIVIKRKQPT